MPNSIIGVPAGGTGASTAAGARTNLGVDIGDGAAGLSRLPRGWLAGLQLTAQSTNSITIGAGEARSADNAVNFVLPSSFVKDMGAAFAVGTGAGGRAVAIPATGDFHIFGMTRDSDGLADVIGDTSPTGANKPGGWTVRRRLLSFRSSGSNLIAITQLGDEFRITSPAVDSSAAASTGSRTLIAVNVPGGFKMIAILNATSNASMSCYVSSPDQADQAPSTAFATWTSALGMSGFQVRTDTARRVGVRGSAATTVNLSAIGWIDTRGRDD